MGRDDERRDEDFSSDELFTLREFFRDEAQETLERLTGHLLAIGDAPTEAVLTEMMRATHTMKGSAGTVGLPDLVSYAHAIEDELARLRGGRISWSVEVREHLVTIFDALRAYVDALGDPVAKEAARIRLLEPLGDLTAMGPARSAESTQVGVAPAARAVTSPPVRESGPTPNPGRSSTPLSNPVMSAPAVRPGSSGHGGDGVVEPYQHTEDTTRSVVAGDGARVSDTSERHRRDSAGVLRVDASRIDHLMDSVGELVVDRTRIERRVDGLRALARDLGGAHLRVAEHLAGAGASSSEAGALLGAIEPVLGELCRQLFHTAGGLVDEIDALRRTTDSVRSGLTQVRMSSAESLYRTLARQLRTIARDAHKSVDLVTSGAETEFDKTVAERITDPLVQLLRNAVAHGIESADERLALGKNPRGEIHIDARQEGNEVVLELSDDGAGIDPDVLRQRFVAQGLWSQAKADLASDEDVLRAIFDPGMSTRHEADSLAGRGVGLDAVRETIAKLGGEVRMTSTPGRGTHFTLRLPVSTAVTTAFLFKVSHDVYALPNVHVVDTIGIERAHDGVGDRVPARVEHGGVSLPVLGLPEILQTVAPVEMPTVPALVVEYVGRRFALACDRLVGPREIVVKHLGPLLASLPLYAGATISGSGKVQLILDPATLVRMAYPELPAVSDAMAAGDAVPRRMPTGPVTRMTTGPAVRLSSGATGGSSPGRSFDGLGSWMADPAVSASSSWSSGSSGGSEDGLEPRDGVPQGPAMDRRTRPALAAPLSPSPTGNARPELSREDMHSVRVLQRPELREPIGPGARVLVVDDSPTIREAVANILTNRGYFAEVAMDGAEAWAMLGQGSYELVITDLEMPNMSGFGLLERMRTTSGMEAIPVIVVSSRDEPSNRVRAHALGVHGFVSKPVTPQKLATALKVLTGDG